MQSTRSDRVSTGEKDRPNRRPLRDQHEQDDRRNGQSSRTDQRWSREADNNRPSNQDRGGWRDRDKRFDRDHNRQNTSEREPEWFDEPAQQSDDGQAHTVAEFEKWKASMKAAKSHDVQPPQQTPVEEPLPSATKSSTLEPADPGLNTMSFGNWGEKQTTLTAAVPVESQSQQKPTPAPAKAKASRFASIFAPPKDESQAAMANNTLIPDHVNVPAPSMTAHSDDDQAGFQRMMQMLRGNSISSPQAAPSPSAGGGLSAFFQSVGSDPASGRQSQAQNQPMSSAPPGLGDQPRDPKFRGQDAQSRQFHSQDRNDDDSRRRSQAPDTLVNAPPPRTLGTPDASSLNKDTEFLLNLIQVKGGNNPANMQNFGQREREPQQMHKVAPPPGFFDHAPPPHFANQQQQHQMQLGPGVMDRLNPTTQRPPPGFFDDSAMVHGNMPGQGRPMPGFNAPPGPPGRFPPRDPPGFGPPPSRPGQDQNGLHHEQLPPGFPPGMRFPGPGNMLGGQMQQQGPGPGPMPGNLGMPLPPFFSGPSNMSGPMHDFGARPPGQMQQGDRAPDGHSMGIRPPPGMFADIGR